MACTHVSHVFAPANKRFGAPISSFYLVRFADNSYLYSYLDSGALFTPARDRAKTFRTRERAENVARLLNGHVCEIAESAPRRLQVSASQFVCCQILVELGGAAQFCGVFPAIPGSEPLVLFNAKSGSTLGLPLSQLTATAVKRKVEECDAAFDAAAVQP